MQAENPSDPEFFLALLDFCEHYMRWQKWQFPEHLLEDLATSFAEGIFLRIQNKGPIDTTKSIKPFINYMNVCRKPVFYRYYNNDRRTITVLKNSPEEDALLKNFCDTEEFHTINRTLETESTIRNIPEMVLKILDTSKYYEDTVEYLNARVSLLLSLLLKDYVPYNQSESEEMYGRMLYRRLYDKFADTIRDTMYRYDIKEFTNMELYAVSINEQREDGN